MARVFIVHGWGGHEKEGWFPWLKNKLEEKGFEVFVPTMPDTNHPRIDAWIDHLKEVVGEVDQDTHFVGHSIGCQTIMRFLEQLPEDAKVGKLVFVAGFFTLTEAAYETEGDREIARPWIETPINTDKIKSHAQKIKVILSDNDPYVDHNENKALFEKKLDADVSIEHEKGHLSEEHGVMEALFVLKEFE